MLQIHRVTLYSIMVKFEKERISWPLSSTYANVVIKKEEWAPTVTSLAVLMNAYRNPLSLFFKAVEDGDACLSSLEYDSSSFTDGIIYERRPLLDTMVDIWRERNNDNNCRAVLRRKLDADGVKVNSWFAPRNPNLTLFLLASCCDALDLRISEVLEEYERRYIAEHNLRG